MVGLATRFKSQVELEVRRILSSEDVALRTALAEEARSYREFLQKQFQMITLGVTVLAAVGAGLFVWFFSQSVDKTQRDIVSTISEKMIQYNIDSQFKRSIEDLITSQASGPSTTKLIEKAVVEKANLAVGSIANKQIREAISLELRNVRSSDAEEILKRASMPQGAVVAFDNKDGCPVGWTASTVMVGRAIIGAGQTNDPNLMSKAYQQIGGAETQQLTISNLPKQVITVDTVGFSSMDRYNVGGRDYPAVGKAQQIIDIGGNGTPIPTMPPYISFFYCRKD